MSVSDTARRKADHLAIASGAGVLHARAGGLEAVRLRHRALPGRDLADVDLTTELLGARLRAPLLISAMTGGTERAAGVNAALSAAAAEHGIGMALGSGRVLLDEPELLRTFRGAERPPLLLANLGAVQLARPDAAERALALVDLLGADGLSLHLNPIQEAVQPEGEPRFGGVLERIAALVERLAPVPVLVKEVGFGMDREDVRALRGAGVAAVDVAGAGGTNWALVEGRRDPRAGALAAAFGDWGVPTAVAVREAVAVAGGLPVIASGGVRDGVDAAKGLALGARAAAMARPFLIAALDGRASEAVGTAVEQLRVAVWAAGAAGSGDLSSGHLAGMDATSSGGAARGRAEGPA